MTKLVYIGIALILLGIILTIIGTIPAPPSKIRGGGIVMIGPIPIIFGSDLASLRIVIVLAIVLMLLWLIYILLTGSNFW
ncbi:MAG: DUF131 domain-containing protein [Candidatus Syntrophoarchaeum sp. WYZ-LMO15]|nr:MAG: DUF131 domain-containing protein [Candidatus Syntrophoarchaeum sp. WYZ-LMO15]